MSDICIWKVVAQPAIILATVNLLYFKHQFAHQVSTRLILAIALLKAWTMACLAHYHQFCVPIGHEVSSLVRFLSAVGKCS